MMPNQMDTAPRDGSFILLVFGNGHIGQARYIKARIDGCPWEFVNFHHDRFIINYAKETSPIGWLPMPSVA